MIMKELSIEEKATAYDKAVKIAKSKIEYDKDHVLYEDDITEIFPELKESEGERIRKELLNYLRLKYEHPLAIGYNYGKWIAWVEKQHEQKPMMIQWQGNNLKEVIDFTGKNKNFEKWFKSFEEYEQYVQTHNGIFKIFNADGSHYEIPVGAWIVKTPDGYNVPSKAKYIQKIEPKFKVGDIIQFKGYGHNRYTIKEVVGSTQYINSDGNRMDRSYTDANFELIAQQTDKEMIEALRTEYEKGRADAMTEVQKPAWSEEDLICLGYLADFVDKNGDEFYGNNKPKVVKWIRSFANLTTPQQEWSEEDEDYRADINSAVNNYFDEGYAEELCDWLKSLKDRVQPQSKQEWSKEDSEYLDSIIESYKDLIADYKASHDVGYMPYDSNTVVRTVKNDVNFLKSLKKRYHWMPSDEQIIWLYRAADVSDKDSRMKQVLNELLEQLKKLKKE